MKKSIVILFSLLTACHTTIINHTPEGVYVCEFENEFSKVADTLLMQKLNGNYFKIIRHSGVVTKGDNKMQLISEVWKLQFESKNNVFNEMRFGKIIIWDEDKGELIFGNREYKKL